MITTHQLLLILMLSNIFPYPQALASEPKAVVEVGFKPCKITAEQLASMPLKGEPTIYPRDIRVVTFDPLVRRPYWNESTEFENDIPEPPETTSLKQLLENLDNKDPELNTSNFAALIDVDANGFCDLLISSPYLGEGVLYLSDSKGNLINKTVKSDISSGEFSVTTPIYLSGSDIPYIYFDISDPWGGGTELWTWNPSTKQPISNTYVNANSSQNEITIYTYFYEQAVSKAIEALRKGLIKEADTLLNEAMPFDMDIDYKRTYYAGIILYLYKNYDLAEHYFLLALDIPKLTTEEQALIIYNLGLTQQALKKPKEALESFNKYLILTPQGQYTNQVKQIVDSLSSN